VITCFPTMEDRFASFRKATAASLLTAPATTLPELRQAVTRGAPPPELAALVEKIRRHAYEVTDSDLDALRGRYTEDQLFEIVVAAAFGAAQERLAAGLRALDEA
jgi:alkylhydroperoxidase family enzyme